MNAVKHSEVLVHGPEERHCPGLLQRATQGYGDAGQLKKQLPSTEDHDGKSRIYFLFFFSPDIQAGLLQM